MDTSDRGTSPDRIDEATTLEERALVARVRAGERAALKTLYERYADEMYGTAFRLTQSTADARDIVQDVFAGLRHALARFDGESGLGTWLYRVTTRRVLVALRRNRRREEFVAPAEAMSSGRVDVPDVITSVGLERALEALPEDLRTVLVLKECEGYSHEEIAAMLDILPGTSRKRMWRARIMLQSLL